MKTEITQENILRYIASTENVNKLISGFFKELPLEKPKISLHKCKHSNDFYLHINYCYYKKENPAKMDSYSEKFKYKEITIFIESESESYNLLDNIFMINCGEYFYHDEDNKRVLITTGKMLKSDIDHYKNENIIVFALDRDKFDIFHKFNNLIEIAKF